MPTRHVTECPHRPTTPGRHGRSSPHSDAPLSRRWQWADSVTLEPRATRVTSALGADAPVTQMRRDSRVTSALGDPVRQGACAPRYGARGPGATTLAPDSPARPWSPTAPQHGGQPGTDLDLGHNLRGLLDMRRSPAGERRDLALAPLAPSGSTRWQRLVTCRPSFQNHAAFSGGVTGRSPLLLAPLAADLPLVHTHARRFPGVHTQNFRNGSAPFPAACPRWFTTRVEGPLLQCSTQCFPQSFAHAGGLFTQNSQAFRSLRAGHPPL